MERGQIERRRGRRVKMQAPLLVRGVKGVAAEPFTQETIHNVGLSGVYFETQRSDAYAVNDVMITSVSFAEPDTHTFPFRRLAGRSRVVRVEPLPTTNGGRPCGVALEFSEDLIALSALPPRR